MRYCAQVKRNPETVAQAVKLREEGKTTTEIADALGVSWRTAKNMSDPVAYADHKRRAMEWQSANPDKAKLIIRKYRRRDDVRERRNSALRERYANDPEYRAQRDAWTLKRAQDLQPRIAQAIRSMTWAIFGGETVPWIALASAGIGKELKAFAVESGAGNSTDHIVPLCLFDLTNPVHLLKAIHWSNVRRIPLTDNMNRSDAMPDGITIDALPYVNSDEAIAQAKAMISRVSSR